jgi:uncharacterized phosphosugar-binding protein
MSNDSGRHAKGYVQDWMAAASGIVETINATQMDHILEAASLCADAIGAGGLVHLFGTGHSRIPLEEMFPRYGSFPGFHPMAELSMTFHTQVVGVNGQRQAMFIERVEGLGEVILSNFSFGDKDVMMVFSTGGSTAVPIDVAIGARTRGMPVIAITAIEHSRASTSGHSSGTRLLDHADVVIDLGIPPGDSLVEIDGPSVTVGPGSTMANVAVVNAIKVAVASLLHDRGDLPAVITAAQLVGSDKSQSLFDAAYADHARRLGALLSPPDDGGDRVATFD